MNSQELHPDDAARLQLHRDEARKGFSRAFGADPVLFVSAPGRTELGGNHTDHNRGMVLAAAVSLDTRAAVRPAANDLVTVVSEGYGEIKVDLHGLHPQESERHSTAALIRGVASRLRELGYEIGGFAAWVTSDVAVGSGLSSSAAFEVLIGGVLNELYNSGTIPSETLASVGQHAENVFFDKPCGLMDQLCSALGGAMKIDFVAPDSPRVRKVGFRPDLAGYALIIVNTGGSHADLTPDYASIPFEMRAVAHALGGADARDITVDLLLERLEEVRKKCGDRAVLRCFHFLDENERVDGQVEALETGDFERFLELVRASGESSLRLLQNGHSAADPRHQGVMLGIELTRRFLRRSGRGACRVHGGGFAGTIQAYIPEGEVQAYRSYLGRWFGEEAVRQVAVRHQGIMRWDAEGS
jgi:galactokinase